MEECIPIAFQSFIAPLIRFLLEREGTGYRFRSIRLAEAGIHLFIQATSLPRRRWMHRRIDVAVRRVVLHVQDVIHAMRDHPALSDKTQKDVFLSSLLLRSFQERKYRPDLKVNIVFLFKYLLDMRDIRG